MKAYKCVYVHYVDIKMKNKKFLYNLIFIFLKKNEHK